MSKITYTVKVSFGSEVLTTQKNDFKEVNNLCEVVLDLGGKILEIEVDEMPGRRANDED